MTSFAIFFSMKNEFMLPIDKAQGRKEVHGNMGSSKQHKIFTKYTFYAMKKIVAT